MPPQIKEEDDSRTPLLTYDINKFTINASQLVGLIEHPNLLLRLGGTIGICQSLRVDPTTGLLPDESFDPCYGIVSQKVQYAPNFFADRKSIFGKNEIPSAPAKTLFQLIWAAYNDQTLSKLLAHYVKIIIC